MTESSYPRTGKIDCYHRDDGSGRQRCIIWHMHLACAVRVTRYKRGKGRRRSSLSQRCMNAWLGIECTMEVEFVSSLASRTSVLPSVWCCVYIQALHVYCCLNVGASCWGMFLL